jgi:hypothetical protein
MKYCSHESYGVHCLPSTQSVSETPSISVMESNGIRKRNNIKHNIHIINQELLHNFRESWNIALTSYTIKSNQLYVIQIGVPWQIPHWKLRDKEAEVWTGVNWFRIWSTADFSGGVYEHLGSLEFLEQFNNCLLWSHLHIMNRDE